MIVVLGLLWCNTSFAESTLPPCQGEDHTQFVNCYGSYVGKDYSEIYNEPGLTSDYTGEFGNSPGLSHGKGFYESYINGEYVGKYVGEFKDDKADGQGTVTYADGAKYVGEWKNDKANGQGTMTYADGTKYVGEWKNNEANGQGTIMWADDGNTYVGEWKDDLYHGQGTLTFADGAKYVGGFKEGKQNGQGTLRYAEGGKYEEFNYDPVDGTVIYVGGFKDDKPHGLGTITWSDGEKYERFVAEFRNDTIKGPVDAVDIDKGIFEFVDYQATLPPCQGEDHTQFVNCYGSYLGKSFSDGDDEDTFDYTGEFGSSPGLANGKGISRDYYNRKLLGVYVGEFKDDKAYGQGIYIRGETDTKPALWATNGFKYIGEWKDNQFHGQGTLTDPTGIYGKVGEYVGEFKDNMKHGQGTWTNADADSVCGYTGEYKDGKRHGQGTSLCMEGQQQVKYVGEWKNDESNGYGIVECRNLTKEIQFDMKVGGTLECKSGRIIEAIWNDWKIVDIIKLNF